MNQIKTVRNFIIENFLFGELGQLKNDTSFLGSGTIDSTGILELVSFLEETFAIEIDDEEIIPENLDTLNNIGQFLERKLPQQKS